MECAVKAELLRYSNSRVRKWWDEVLFLFEKTPGIIVSLNWVVWVIPGQYPIFFDPQGISLMQGGAQPQPGCLRQ